MSTTKNKLTNTPDVEWCVWGFGRGKWHAWRNVPEGGVKAFKRIFQIVRYSEPLARYDSYRDDICPECAHNVAAKIDQPCEEVYMQCAALRLTGESEHY